MIGNAEMVLSPECFLSPVAAAGLYANGFSVPVAPAHAGPV